MSDIAAVETTGEPNAGAGTSPVGSQTLEHHGAQQTRGDDIAADIAAAIDGTGQETTGTEGAQEGAQGAQETQQAETGTEGTGEGEKAAQAMEPPAHWAVEDQNRFREATPEWQAWFVDRSKAMDAAHAERSRELAPFRQLSESWNPYVAQHGGNLPQVLNGLMQTEHALRTGTPEQRMQILRSIGQDYGVDLTNGAGEGAADTGETGEVDPAIAAMREEMAQLRQHLNGRDQTAEQQRAATIGQEVQQFAAAKDANGNPAHPYLEEVYDDMIQLAAADHAAGKQPTVKGLYDRAIWVNEGVRAKVLASQNHAAEQERKRKEAEQVAKAKRANVQVSGAGSVQATAKADDIDAILEEMVPRDGWT